MRPAFLPMPGEPATLQDVVTIVNHYLGDLQRELCSIEGRVAERIAQTGGTMTGRVWSPSTIHQQWGKDLDRIFCGHVMVDEISDTVRFKSVLISIDKLTGEIVVADDRGLMT